MRSYGYLRGTGSRSQKVVTVNRDRLVDVIRPMLTGIVVDEEWYRNTYPDVRAAIAAGEWRSGQEHWMREGHFEDRLPHRIEVDAAWYSRSYQDVAEAVEAGTFTDVEQHFLRDGYREGRLPYEGWNLLEAVLGPARQRNRVRRKAVA